MTTRKITTSHVYPPIPIRDWDWCAYYEGEEEAGNYGWGRTEDEAIADFNENCRADHDERLEHAETLRAQLGARCLGHPEHAPEGADHA